MRILKFQLAAGILGVIGILGSDSEVLAEVLTLEPNQAAVLPADSAGVTRAVFFFDVSGLPTGAGTRVEEAVLLWPLAGLSLDAAYEFSLHEVAGAWTPEAVGSLLVPLALGAEVDSWITEARSNEGNRGVLVRLGLRRSVDAWRTGRAVNFGVVVATRELSRETLAGQLSSARLYVWCSRSEQTQ